MGLVVILNPRAVGTLGGQVLPWLLVAGGAFQVLGAFGSRRRGLFVPLLTGSLMVVFGLALRFANNLPFFNLSLMMGLLFLASGGAKLLFADLAAGTAWRQWIWVAAGVSIAMGLVVLLAWSSIASGLVAFFLGIELLSSAAALTAIALARRAKEGG